MLSRPAFLVLAAALVLLPARGDDLQDRYGSVDIRPGKSSIFIGTVTLTMPPFVRKNGVFTSTYSATVFPYFFFDETGTITIDVPDEMLRRVARGERIGFAGLGTSDEGDNRRVEGSAEPIDSTTGRITVRVYVSKRLSLAFNTSYRLKPNGTQ